MLYWLTRIGSSVLTSQQESATFPLQIINVSLWDLNSLEVLLMLLMSPVIITIWIRVNFSQQKKEGS